MATITGTFITKGVGEVWSMVIAEWATYITAAGSAFTLTPGTASGYRSVLMSTTHGGNTYNYTYVATDIPAASIASLRNISMSPGWRTRPTRKAAFTGAASASIISWRAAIVPFRRAVWSTWGGGTLGSTQSGDGLCESGQSSGFYDYFVVSRLYEFIVDATLIYGWLATSTHGFTSQTGPCDGIDTAGSGPGLDVSGIVDALNEMNNSTTDISLNHGQTVFSVKGGTVIG